MLFTVFDQITGKEGKTTYRVVDFVGGIIHSSRLTDKENEHHMTIQVVEFVSPGLIIVEGDETAPLNNSVSTPMLIQ